MIRQKHWVIMKEFKHDTMAFRGEYEEKRHNLGKGGWGLVGVALCAVLPVVRVVVRSI